MAQPPGLGISMFMMRVGDVEDEPEDAHGAASSSPTTHSRPTVPGRVAPQEEALWITMVVIGVLVTYKTALPIDCIAMLYEMDKDH
eukprot:6181438-Amphidinium_carterae.2